MVIPVIYVTYSSIRIGSLLRIHGDTAYKSYTSSMHAKYGGKRITWKLASFCSTCIFLRTFWQGGGSGYGTTLRSLDFGVRIGDVGENIYMWTLWHNNSPIYYFRFPLRTFEFTVHFNPFKMNYLFISVLTTKLLEREFRLISAVGATMPSLK